ncbi:hypothetical protein ACI3KW_09110 [Devosia sp. ZW T5_3]|uniref:hypothetical protein n=1 Tax=Devosia sp. ZW T5_3 TaxID=3378085 RepID=UPI0038526724
MSLAGLADADPFDALNALRIFAERWGASNFLAKKVAFIMALHSREQLTDAFAEFAEVVQQTKYPAPYFTAMEAIDMEFPYFSGIPARVALFSRLVDHDGHRQVLPLHNVAASPMAPGDVGPFLRKSYSMSFVDEIVAIAQLRYVGNRWPGIASTLKTSLAPSIADKLAELEMAPFDSSRLYASVTPEYADLAYYRRALAFLEYPEPCNYRQYIDLVIAPRLLAKAGVPETDLARHPKPGRKDLTKGLNGFRRPMDYLSWQNVGRFLRTVHFLVYLSDDGLYTPLDQHEVRHIFEHTQGLDVLLHEREIERLYLTADETSKLIVTTLALALYKERSHDDDVDFKFRKSLSDAITARFNGDVTAFVEWLLPSSPEVANFVLSTLDRDTLHKLYWIVKSPDEADVTRQNILRAVGKRRQEIAYFIEADAIEAQRKVAKLSKYFDDSRMYVDSLAMKKWLTENPSAYAQQFMRLVELAPDFPTAPRPALEAERKATEIFATAKFDYILVEAATKTFEQFCLNESFGIESYLSRRIRHNTLAGMMRSEVETLIEQPRFDVLTYDEEFIQAERDWSARYRLEVERIRRDLLQFRTDGKQQGILNARPNMDDQGTKANVNWLKNLVIATRSADLFNELLVRFCWLQIEPQLKSAARLFSVDMVNDVTERIETTFGSAGGDLGEQYKAELKKLVHGKFARLASWFRQPDTAFVPATARDIGDLIFLEAPKTDDTHLDWTGSLVGILMDGLSVHRIYDCLFVLIRNALKYGQSGPISVSVEGTTQRENRIALLHVEVESRLTEDLEIRRSQLANLEASFREANTAVYMVKEDFSGIKKLRYIIGSPTGVAPPSFRVVDDRCVVYFEMMVELAEAVEGAHAGAAG